MARVVQLAVEFCLVVGHDVEADLNYGPLSDTPEIQKISVKVRKWTPETGS